MLNIFPLTLKCCFIFHSFFVDPPRKNSNLHACGLSGTIILFVRRFDEKIHSLDFGSTYNFYCPEGVAYPVRVTTGKCSSGFINNDKYLASQQGGCPQLKLQTEDGAVWSEDTKQYSRATYAVTSITGLIVKCGNVPVDPNQAGDKGFDIKIEDAAVDKTCQSKGVFALKKVETTTGQSTLTLTTAPSVGGDTADTCVIRLVSKVPFFGTDLKKLVRPAQSNIKIVLKNSGDGVLEIGINEGPELNWLTLEQDGASAGAAVKVSSDSSSPFPAEYTLKLLVKTGEISGDIVDGENAGFSNAYYDSIELWWKCNGRTGTKKFTVRVELVENSNMLVFPFAVDESVVAGTTKEIPVFVFNIGADAYNPFINAAQFPIADFVSLSGDTVTSVGRPLPCIVPYEVTFSQLTQYISEPVGASCTQGSATGM